jgi:Flp pilus assembly pilin Flp
MTNEYEIDRATFRQGTTQSITELHITGGQRAIEQPGRLWSWYPVLSEGQVRNLAPRPIQQIAALANAVGLDLFGGDEQSGLEGPLVSRIWTPLDGPHAGGLQPADLWRAIARNADGAGDIEYALLARHISYSLTAAEIRLRDASDGYHAQLMAAIQSKTTNGCRFSNIPMRDLQLAFHSVLSELASTRDYLAASVALKLGAPAKIDAMNRFKEWVSAVSRAHLASGPVAAAMLAAYDSGSADPWLHQLTEYRNLYLHRVPLGSTTSAAPALLTYTIVEHAGTGFPRITMPLDASDPSAPGQDALARFLQLYRAMTRLVKLAADHAPYDTSMPVFVVR